MSKTDPTSKELAGQSMTSSSRSAFILDWVFAAWNDLPANQLNLVAEEITHVRAVASLMTVLAPFRGLDPELAGIIGLLHDAGRLRPGGVIENHAERGASEVLVFLKENQLLSESSQSAAVHAIRRHSAKGKHQEAYDELLKDADVFQRFLEGEPVLSKPSWRKRAAVVLEELSRYAVKAGDHTLILSTKDQRVGDSFFRFLTEVESWLMLRRHHVLDEESVHDFRVFIRQTKALQSFFKPLFKTGPYERGQALLRDALHTFEEAREAAVELRALEAYASSLDSGLKTETQPVWIALRLEALAERAHVAVAEAGDFSWVDALDAWHRNMKKATCHKSVAKMPLETFALEGVSRWLRQWTKHYGHLDFDNDILIHKSRIDVKKIRYVIRALEKIIPADSGALLGALERYQALSGALHDVAVSKTLLAQEGWDPRDGQVDAARDPEGHLSGYLNFRDQQSREFREQLRSAHNSLTGAIEGWLEGLE